MKPIYISAIICTTIICLILQSCCTKKLCQGFENESQLIMVGFANDEVDSIIVETFHGNDFTNRIDSLLKSAYLSTIGDDHTLNLPRNLSKSHAYRITVLATGQIFRIHSLTTKKETCNNCFPYHPEYDYYEVLDSYFINDVLRNSSVITMVK